MQQYDPEKLTREDLFSLAVKRISVEVPSFRNRDWHKMVKRYALFVIAKNTSDFPGKYTVRMFDLNRPTCLVAVKNTLVEARKAVPLGYRGFKRSAKDDPVIVETWM